MTPVPSKRLPSRGTPRAELLARMRDLKSADADWQTGRTWALVYHADDATAALLKEAYNFFFAENALNPLAFPSLRQFENEVIAMTADLLGGGAETVGSMTSGGTESVLMAVKAARQKARAERSAITAPEMVLPVSAHPAFEKAAHYFDVKAVRTPLGPDLRADVAAAAAALTPNTILMVGSAPCFPYGVIDPIAELAALAAARGIPFHVDACLGGLLLPFVRRLGYPVPDFDFRVPGVTSISADLHKYGYAAKGASTILYRNKELRRHQFFVYADWPGGLYASPTMTGTRPGGAIAAAWAVMNYLGAEGYLNLARTVMATTTKLIDGIAAIPGLKVMGRPDMSVVAFTSDTLDVFALGDAMQARGWFLDRQQMPPALHLMVTPPHAAIADDFLHDLAATAAQVAAAGAGAPQGAAAIYGMMATLPDRTMAHTLLLNLMDDLAGGGRLSE